MMGCNKCFKATGIMFLVLGILFLLVDLEVGGFTFWGIQWWTALLLVAGIGHYASSTCPQCQALRQPKKK